MDDRECSASLERAIATAKKIHANVETVIRGKSREIKLALTGFIAGKHVLIEDVPGTGKTMLAKAIAKSIGGTFKRVQGNPDLLPTDLTGLRVFNQQTRTFDFKRGPVETNILLYDEINRTTPKTQSALLETMEERQVTIDDETYPLPKPFFVIATQNPIEHEGTYALPEAQLDRFLIKMTMGYPGFEDEVQIVVDQREKHPIDAIEPVASLEEVLALQEAVASVQMAQVLREWIVALVRQTRTQTWESNDRKVHRAARLGASPRGSIGLASAVRAWALLHGRGFVCPDDVKELLVPVLGHRIILEYDYVVEQHEGNYERALAAFFDACLKEAALEHYGAWLSPDLP